MTPPDPRLTAHRGALGAALVGFFLVLGGVSTAAVRFEREYRQLEMKMLPRPTEEFLKIARAMHSPWVLTVLGLALTLACLRIRKGACDEHRKWFLGGVLGATILINGLFVASLYLPFIRISCP